MDMTVYTLNHRVYYIVFVRPIETKDLKFILKFMDEHGMKRDTI
jgi:hypothetical protein